MSVLHFCNLFSFIVLGVKHLNNKTTTIHKQKIVQIKLVLNHFDPKFI